MFRKRPIADNKLSELQAAERQGDLPPVMNEKPLADDGIFYKQEPLRIIKSKKTKQVIWLAAFCAMTLGFFVYYFFFTDFRADDFPIIIGLSIILAVVLASNLKSFKFPVAAEIYDTGIWFNNYGLFAPYERLHTVNLIFETKARAARVPSVLVCLQPQERKKRLKNWTLKIGNIPIRNKELLKLDFGLTETFIEPDIERTIEDIYLLAAERNEDAGLSPPLYNVDNDTSEKWNFLSFLARTR